MFCQINIDFHCLFVFLNDLTSSKEKKNRAQQDANPELKLI